MNTAGAVPGVLFGGTPRDTALQDAALLREVLDQDLAELPAGPADRPFLVVLSGLPGTGKSHFARELGKLLPLLILESDRLRKVLVPQPRYTPGESGRLFAACHLLIEEYLSHGRRVLFDATNLTDAFRQPLYQIGERTSASLVLVRLTAPGKIVRRRLSERTAGLHPSDYSDAGWLIYTRMYPHEEAIHRGHLTVDSSGDISWALDTVARMVNGSGDGRSSKRPKHSQ